MCSQHRVFGWFAFKGKVQHLSESSLGIISILPKPIYYIYRSAISTMNQAPAAAAAAALAEREGRRYVVRRVNDVLSVRTGACDLGDHPVIC